jgi:ATP-binding cassette, subfamily B, bacterial
VFTSVVLAGIEIVFPAVLGGTLDAVLAGEDATSWLVGAGLLIAVLFVCDALDDLGAGVSTARATAWLRRSLFDQVLALGTRTASRVPPRTAGNTISIPARTTEVNTSRTVHAPP